MDVENENIKREIRNDLDYIYKLFIAFHEKYKFYPTQFVIDENNISIYDIESGKPIIYYELDNKHFKYNWVLKREVTE